MAARTKYFFRQRVSEAELNLGFDLLEKADRDFASDINVYGIIGGAEPSPHSPVPNLSVDLTAAARAYDRLGQRIYFGTSQVVDVSKDLTGIPTDVAASGNERWVTIFLRFKRAFSDPRTDGNSQQIMFRQDESYELVVRQAPAAAAGSAPRPPLEAEELLVCDVLRRAGQTQIVQGDIDLVRRQVFVFAQSKQVSVAPQGWTVLSPLAAATVQATFDKVDAELRGHFTGTARKHAASAIDFTPHGFVTTPTVQGAVSQLVDALGSQADNTSGASRIGAAAVPGDPETLPAGNVATQLASLLDALNYHEGGTGFAHHAAYIQAQPHRAISSDSVQGQLQEIVADLASMTTGASGAETIGVQAIAGSPNSLPTHNMRGAIEALLGLINAQNTAYDRDHFLAGSNSGQHRVIRQPAGLGTGRVLIFDSAASGFALTHFRIYVDASSVGTDSVWLTMNCGWDNASSTWVRDSAGTSCSAIRLSGYDFAFHCKTGIDGSATFTTWTTTWRLPFGADINSALETTGRIKETGRCGVQYHNTSSGTVTVYVGGSVTFRSRLAATPSSITFTSIMTSGGPPSISVLNATTDRDGFGYQVSGAAAGNNTLYWFGTYTATA